MNLPNSVFRFSPSIAPIFSTHALNFEVKRIAPFQFARFVVAHLDDARAKAVIRGDRIAGAFVSQNEYIRLEREAIGRGDEALHTNRAISHVENSWVERDRAAEAEGTTRNRPKHVRD